MIKRVCKVCSKEFQIQSYLIKKNRGKYCSRKCYYQSMKGHPKYNLTGKGQFKKGQSYFPEYQFKKGHIPWHKGKGIITKKCKQCDNFFETYQHQIKREKGKFCSLKCRGIFTRGKNHHWWKGGKTKNSKGYFIIYKPNHPYAIRKHILEHRFIIEKYIDRYLLPKEQSHHLNEIRDDNRPKNLMAFVNMSAHKRFEMGGKVKPKEIIFDGRKL